MFSHPAAPPPPQQPRDSEVAGSPELDDRWARAATHWEPEVRIGSRAQWSWLRWAWEELDGWEAPGAGQGAPSAADDSELHLLDACLALLTAFLQAADGRAQLRSAQEVRTEGGRSMRGARAADAVARQLAARGGKTLCFAQLWSLARPEELQEDPWAEFAGAPAAGVPTAADIAGEEAARRPLFPLSTDDIAWIVSGSMTADKDRTWRWCSELTG